MTKPATNSPLVTIVAALSCEVKALLDRYRAKKVCDKPFTLFRAEAESVEIDILISGIGALPMATAIGWLGGYRPAAHRAWLNVGTAGHGSMDLGEAFRVHTSSDILSERKHFPPLIVRSRFVSDEVLSVNAPTSDYPAEGGMDMEAYAFFNAATRFSSNELVQAIKVVSDNPEHSLENLNAQTISALMQPHTEAINEFAFSVATSAHSSISQNNVLVFPEIHITHSQHQQLGVLVNKLAALDVLDQALRVQVERSTSTKALFQLLQRRLDSCVPVI